MTIRDGAVKTVLRLAEIDAPERTQPYSQVSRRNLIALCKDAKAIRFNLSTPIDTVALCSRLLRRRVRQLAASASRLGMVLSQIPNAAYGVLPLEREAMNARRGLWHDDMPVAP